MAVVTGLPVRRFNQARSSGFDRVEKKELVSVRDRAVSEAVVALAASKDELVKINDFIRRGLDLPQDRKRSIVAKLMHLLLPKGWYEHLPEGLMKLIAEEYDVLELIERLMRTNNDNIQEALRELAACAIAKRQELNELAADIKQATDEGWNAATLQNYIATRAEIRIYDEVAQLLEGEFNAFTDEEKDRKKAQLLDLLRSNILVGEELMATAAKVCSAGLEVFHSGVAAYYNYIHFYRPIAIMRDAALIMVDTNQSMYAARDALSATFRASIRAIECAVEAASLAGNYSIASGDMQSLLRSGAKRLEERLKEFRVSSGRNNPAALGQADIRDGQLLE